MGMPIREKQVCSIQVLISRPVWVDDIDPVWIMVAPKGSPQRLRALYRWSLSRTMITAPSGPHGPLFRMVSIAPSGPL